MKVQLPEIKYNLAGAIISQIIYLFHIYMLLVIVNEPTSMKSLIAMIILYTPEVMSSRTLTS